MKKWMILIPTFMCLGTTLPISLTSCKSEYKNYQVSMDDFSKIISMEGVQYLQYAQYVVIDRTTTFMQYELSPTVYHLNMFSDDLDMNNESYGYIENNTYWKIYRLHSSAEWSEPVKIDRASFYTPQKIAENIKFHYQQALTCGSKIDFNNEDLNYQTSYVYKTTLAEESVDAQWNFYKNQIKSFGYSSTTRESGYVMKKEKNNFIDFKYDQFTPVLPE